MILGWTTKFQRIFRQAESSTAENLQLTFDGQAISPSILKQEPWGRGRESGWPPPFLSFQPGGWRCVPVGAGPAQLSPVASSLRVLDIRRECRRRGTNVSSLHLHSGHTEVVLGLRLTGHPAALGPWVSPSEGPEALPIHSFWTGNGLSPSQLLENDMPATPYTTSLDYYCPFVYNPVPILKSSP